MSKCYNCKFRKIEYAPYIKERVLVCTKQGKCEDIEPPRKRGENEKLTK